MHGFRGSHPRGGACAAFPYDVEDLSAVKVFNNNIGAQKLPENLVHWHKHINIRHHFIHEDLLKTGQVKLGRVSTEEMSVDILTKALPRFKYTRCLNLLGLSKSKLDFLLVLAPLR